MIILGTLATAMGVAAAYLITRGLLKQLGYAEGSINARMEKLNLSLQPAAEPDPRAGLIKRYEEILADALKRSEAVFDIRPKAPCVVKREPPFTEKTAAAHYTGPARDGSRPGVFWAPLPGPVFKIFNMRTLVYHEAIPGHHFQLSLTVENATLPKFRRYDGNNAYIEGWALYTEALGPELGLYADPYQYLGMLYGDMHRAVRLVVDTGMHAKGWKALREK